EGFEDVIDLLDGLVRASRRALLAEALVDVAEATFLLEAEVVALAVDGEIDEIAPLDRRRHLADGFPAAERALVVRRCVLELHSTHWRSVGLELERAAGDDHLVRRVGMDAYADDRAPEPFPTSDERDLLGRAEVLLLPEGSHRPAVEAEDEV